MKGSLFCPECTSTRKCRKCRKPKPYPEPPRHMTGGGGGGASSRKKKYASGGDSPKAMDMHKKLVLQHREVSNPFVIGGRLGAAPPTKQYIPPKRRSTSTYLGEEDGPINKQAQKADDQQKKRLGTQSVARFFGGDDYTVASALAYALQTEGSRGGGGGGGGRGRTADDDDDLSWMMDIPPIQQPQIKQKGKQGGKGTGK